MSLYSISQQGIPEFGDISAADLALKECLFEKDAAAFYLLNYAKTDFTSPGINEERFLIKDSVYVNEIVDKEGLLKGEAVTASFHFSRDLRLAEIEKEKGSNDLLSNHEADLKTDSTWLVNKDDGTLLLDCTD